MLIRALIRPNNLFCIQFQRMHAQFHMITSLSSSPMCIKLCFFIRIRRSEAIINFNRRNEREKRRAHDERIREVEHGSFSPLVFSIAGGMGASANVVYKRIASLIADKHGKPYSKTINWLRCRLSFSLLRSAIMCLRGSRSSFHNPINSLDGEVDLALAEGRGSC